MVQHVDTLQVNEGNDATGLNNLEVVGPVGPREGPGPGKLALAECLRGAMVWPSSQGGVRIQLEV
jgi:hypothetical protein